MRDGAYPRESEGPRTRAYLDALEAEFSDLEIVDKAHDRLSAWIARLLRWVTLGKVTNYISEVVTTIGSRVYLPECWAAMTDESRYIVMRHEAVHLRQFRRYGFVLMCAMYLLPIFPIGLAWCRARLEWEAYAETIRASAELYGLDYVKNRRFVRHIVRKFTGADYAWMWPFKKQVKRWVHRAIAELGDVPVERLQNT